MKCLPEGDLTKYVDTPLPRETVQNISNQTLEGLKVMHQEEIAHRNIKPQNLGSNLRVLCCRSRFQPKAPPFTSQCQPLSYGALEVLGLDSNSQSSGYTSPVDIWSVGCVIYELLVGQNLFSSWDQITRYYFGKRPFPRDGLGWLSLY
ncbi:kinase-like domain-containing protein [Tuber borchii]|uniref:Kinase-like domain-containing protein n=1 Tax=Tuber borchii TaxID=42251 RepID=A0A2T6ZU68_TUBBO|nr:kinase-like domain-containing protein [Tuber borchii]